MRMPRLAACHCTSGNTSNLSVWHGVPATSDEATAVGGDQSHVLRTWLTHGSPTQGGWVIADPIPTPAGAAVPSDASGVAMGGLSPGGLITHPGHEPPRDLLAGRCGFGSCQGSRTDSSTPPSTLTQHPSMRDGDPLTAAVCMVLLSHGGGWAGSAQGSSDSTDRDLVILLTRCVMVDVTDVL